MKAPTRPPQLGTAAKREPPRLDLHMVVVVVVVVEVDLDGDGDLDITWT